uniref:alpha-1,2-Mannosidase n=2 Tax=Meloidogyne javanica TaxID=6303 RepID=A0A915N145_MELJA
MFMHGYRSYMENAFPHDELMPLSCKGRQRGVTPSRGDVDDALGNFSLTLVDTLDTLVVLGEFDEFERAVKLAVEQISFDSDLTVSVFETNIRMVGGLISAHLMSLLVKQREDRQRMEWYSDQLFKMATNLADRLLPAFNSTSGVPYSRVNLKKGLLPSLKRQHDTCTACGGTMILEWAALSRLSGRPVYEEKARKAMDFLWAQRHRGSDLMGTVLNVNSGDWVRPESGIGAGIDSYYEYTLKAYILLGDDDYLYRFNKHYDAIMRHLNKGPIFVDVQMHRPQLASRSYMDALLAFWPGIQVLKGDLRGAIEMHQMLYNVVKKHKFLPDAFTHDLQIHWAQHPLRPEFIESTYFLYRATKDPHYLEVAKEVMQSLEQNVRVPCGFASVKDVRTMEHEDQMESFVLAETFKYLYMIFSEPNDLPFHPDNYVLTTEAHFLPLSIAEMTGTDPNDRLPRRMLIDPDEIIEHHDSSKTNSQQFFAVCPTTLIQKEEREEKCENKEGEQKESLTNIEEEEETKLPFWRRTPDGLDVNRILGTMDIILEGIKKSVDDELLSIFGNEEIRLRPTTFNPIDPAHVEQLTRMGIRMEFQPDGRIQLIHTSSQVLIGFVLWASVLICAFTLSIGAMLFYKLVPLFLKFILRRIAFLGLRFIREMGKFWKEASDERSVQTVSAPHFGLPAWTAAPATFGMNFTNGEKVIAEIVLVDPFKACNSSQLFNGNELRGKIAVILRGDCMFEDKALLVQREGAVGLIIIGNNQQGSSFEHMPYFAMSGSAANLDSDGQKKNNMKVEIPVVFLFYIEGQQFLDLIFDDPKMIVSIGENKFNPVYCFEQFLRQNFIFRREQFAISNQFLSINAGRTTLYINFYFDGVNESSLVEEKQAVVERNIEWIDSTIQFPDIKFRQTFQAHLRALAYSLLDYPLNMEIKDYLQLRQLIRHLKLGRPKNVNEKG